jgi:hypothetical protein
MNHTDHLLHSIASFCCCALLACVGCALLDNASDCSSVCEQYADCYDSGFDVKNCRDRCIDESSNSDTYTAKVNSCDACIQGLDCIDNVFQCGTECQGVVD